MADERWSMSCLQTFVAPVDKREARDGSFEMARRRRGTLSEVLDITLALAQKKVEGNKRRLAYYTTWHTNNLATTNLWRMILVARCFEYLRKGLVLQQ